MYASYYRVSTDKQGESGLGLEAQRKVSSVYSPEREFTDIESGLKSDRPQLEEALKYCKETGATLVVAKLDRLSRSVSFTSKLMDAGVNFVCCDMPSANRMTIHILAAVAENEAKMISDRTKAALQAAKARGTKLGGYRGGGWHKASEGVKQRNFKRKYAHILPFVNELKGMGATAAYIAGALDRQGYKTVRGKKFSATQVQRIINEVSNDNH